MDGGRVLVLFDGRCDFCTWAVEWARRRDRTGRLVFRPNQTPGLVAQCGLSRQQVDQAVWTVSPDGALAGGADAVNVILATLGPGWERLGRLLSRPGPRQIEARAYGWVASHRPFLSRWLGVRPECERAGVECDA